MRDFIRDYPAIKPLLKSAFDGPKDAEGRIRILMGVDTPSQQPEPPSRGRGRGQQRGRGRGNHQRAPYQRPQAAVSIDTIQLMQKFADLTQGILAGSTDA
jgi:hypothetical protein